MEKSRKMGRFPEWIESIYAKTTITVSLWKGIRFNVLIIFVLIDKRDLI
ncbi:MAG: hypothetical protein PWQ76_881 [Clostridiales bacterium]|jgi:hypothetical protein|nr:hypothetical protein [Oscillospiraceae bacterium]MDN5378626.1 hypothetical protein [Clostridiales bacterium]